MAGDTHACARREMCPEDTEVSSLGPFQTSLSVSLHLAGPDFHPS